MRSLLVKLVVVLAIALVSIPTASANDPEFVRCVKDFILHNECFR